MPAVRGRGIVERFDDVVVLDGIDLGGTPRQIHWLVGPNGAGKTTQLGLAIADEGRPENLGTPAGRALTGTDGVSSAAASTATSFAHPPATHGTQCGSSTAWPVC
jgi:ABC-type branched-subunit amino acid transport system ATPase component